MEAYVFAAVVFILMLFDDRYIGIFSGRSKSKSAPARRGE